MYLPQSGSELTWLSPIPLHITAGVSSRKPSVSEAGDSKSTELRASMEACVKWMLRTRCLKPLSEPAYPETVDVLNLNLLDQRRRAWRRQIFDHST